METAMNYLPSLFVWVTQGVSIFVTSFVRSAITNVMFCTLKSVSLQKFETPWNTKGTQGYHVEGNIFVPNFFLEKVIVDAINVIKTITDTGNRDLGTLVRS